MAQGKMSSAAEASNHRKLLRQVFAGFPSVRLAVLFGSTARGRQTASSDVDLGVLLAEDDPSQLWPIDVAAGAALRRTIDLVDLRRAPPLLRFEIARDGQPLFESNEGEWVDFKTRAMIDWWDWAPMARQFHRLTAQRLQEESVDGQS